MVDTRSKSNKSKPDASNKAKDAPKSQPKPRSKPKAVRFSFSGETKTNASKRETKNVGHQSRSTRRDSSHGRGSRRSPSPRHSFNRRDFGFPYGVQSYGPSFDWRLPISPYGYYNYPNLNPVGFDPNQHHRGKVSGHYKRRRETSSDSSRSPTDDEWGGLFQSPNIMPAKRTTRAKSGNL